MLAEGPCHLLTLVLAALVCAELLLGELQCALILPHLEQLHDTLLVGSVAHDLADQAPHKLGALAESLSAHSTYTTGAGHASRRAHVEERATEAQTWQEMHSTPLPVCHASLCQEPKRGCQETKHGGGNWNQVVVNDHGTPLHVVPNPLVSSAPQAPTSFATVCDRESS